MLDKYPEIDSIAKKSIIEYFPENKGLVNYYFKCHFEILDEEELSEIFGETSFKKIDIDKAVNNLSNPCILFLVNKGKINMSLDYMISEAFSDQILVVRIDEKLNVKKFLHES